MEQAISNGGICDYYEVVFAEMISDGSLSLECVVFDADQWYEVDTLDDLRGAERIFSLPDTPSLLDLPLPFDIVASRA